MQHNFTEISKIFTAMLPGSLEHNLSIMTIEGEKIRCEIHVYEIQFIWNILSGDLVTHKLHTTFTKKINICFHNLRKLFYSLHMTMSSQWMNKIKKMINRCALLKRFKKCIS